MLFKGFQYIIWLKTYSTEIGLRKKDLLKVCKFDLGDCEEDGFGILLAILRPRFEKYSLKIVLIC